MNRHTAVQRCMDNLCRGFCASKEAKTMCCCVACALFGVCMFLSFVLIAALTCTIVGAVYWDGQADTQWSLIVMIIGLVLLVLSCGSCCVVVFASRNDNRQKPQLVAGPLLR